MVANIIFSLTLLTVAVIGGHLKENNGQEFKFSFIRSSKIICGEKESLYVPNVGSCIRLFDSKGDFNSAQNGCKSYGGHLITYDENSDEKFDAIDMQLKNTRKDITEVLLGTVLLDNGTLLDTNTDKLSKLTIDTPPERFCKPYCNLLLHSDISLLKTTHEIRAASQNRTFDSYACEKAGTSKILPVSTTVIALMLLSLLIYSDETM